ncbi:MAG: hypothetical protein E7042_09135 [Lentisphaerae bacterium]|nr:hypothetical protein [Lentisphaerota bacterium]
MLTALIWTFVTAIFFATISATVSFLARDKMSSFHFFTIGNLAASAIAWIVLPDWSMAGEVNWGMLFLFALATGIVNTASQAMLVLTLKLGHNGLTIAIRNLAAVISMFFALIFLHEKVSPVNFSGVAIIIISLTLIAVFSKKSNVSHDLKKWIPSVIIALLLSGAYQILLTGSLLLPESTRRAGVLTPALFMGCGISNLVISLFEISFRKIKFGTGIFNRRTLTVTGCWVAAAILQYFALFQALDAMKKCSMAALAWPLIIAINTSSFAIFCRLRWKEKYPITTIIGMIGCILGVILTIWGRK